LRRARELAYRDLGGLVYNLHRFGQRNDPLVFAKLGTLGLIDNELRTIETALAERRPVTVLREAGITACPRCAAIHGSEDRYCPNCGLPMSRHADLPIAGAPAGAPPAADGAVAQPQPAPQSAAPPLHASPPAAAPAAAAPRPAPAAPAPQPAPPAPQPVPQPAPAAAAPPTQRHPLSQPPSPPDFAPGRSPSPPPRPSQGGQPAGARPEETTEIIRPPGADS